MEFLLSAIPPFDLGRTAWAVRRRGHNLVDRFDDGVYRRVLLLGERAVVCSVTRHGEAAVAVRLPGRVSAVARARAEMSLNRLLGLQVDLAPFLRRAARDPPLRELARRFRGLKPPRFSGVFETLLNGIACQQISLNAGITLLNRLAEACGPDAGEFHALPRPADLAGRRVRELRELGFSGNKSRALLELAERTAADPSLEQLDSLDDEAAVARLEELRGIGRWTAEYVLLRGLGRLHVFPGDDVGARRRLEQWLGTAGPLDYAGVRHTVARWGSWAGVVYFHLLLRGLAERGIDV